MSTMPPLEDIFACQMALFEWADSYDSKDWERLKSCIAPTLRIDYSKIMDKVWDAMPAEDFIAMASNPHFLGNMRIKTQHFVGTSKWMQQTPDAVIGVHQLRVAHQRFADDACTEVKVKGHAHGTATITYRKVNGGWKFAGLVPNIRWTEHDYDSVFTPNEAFEGAAMQ